MAGGLRPPLSQTFTAKIILILTLLPFTLAFFAFILQWRGGINDPSTHYSNHHHNFPGMETSPPTTTTLTATTSSPSLPRPRPECNQLTPFHYDHVHFQTHLKPKIAITTSTSASLEQILPWMFFHKVIGVTTFYLFVDGKAAKPDVSSVLESIPGVKVIYRTKELQGQQARSRIWNETWLSSFFYKPCNYELFVNQSLNMEMAIVMAKKDGVEWILHLDTDELVHPAGTREYSLRQLLLDVPSNVDMVVFPNYESSVERDDIQDPFSEVSMFKKNYDHLPKDTYFGMYKEATRGNPNYFLTYGNGKAIARVQDHLRPNGAHRWHNYKKTPNEVKFEEAAVLHYTYSKFSDLTSRRDRCECKPTKEDVKRCFMLEFDREAFIIASTATEEEMRKWYQEHVVWGDKTLKVKLLRKGILTRIYEPMVIVQGLRESGIFTSIIESASTPFSKDKFLSPIENSNSTRHDKVISYTKTDTESHATARKVLEFTDVATSEAAIPPLPAPGLDENHSRSDDFI